MRSSDGKMTNRMVRLAQGTISWEMRRMTCSLVGMSRAAVPDSAAHSGMTARPFDMSRARTSPFSGRKPKMSRKMCDAVHRRSVKMTKSESTHRVVTSASMR